MTIENYRKIIASDQIIETNWCVITGPPSSGKTTIINKLSKLGYNIVNDVGREVIIEHIHTFPKIDERKKQKLIVDRLLQKYSEISSQDLVFMDYGMPDNIVFQKMAGFSIYQTLKAATLIRYKKVFLLSPLRIEYDGIRDLNPAKQRTIYDEILKQYLELGYNPIKIQSGDFKNRCDHILKEAL